MKICLIPARGGSKRIPRKNIRPFRGKPMIAWSIAAAQASKCFDQVLVSTDDQEIAEVARAHGADVPFLRPAHLADDKASTQAVICYALEWTNHQGEACEALCCLYATAPFVQADDLLQAQQRLMESRPGTVVFAATSFPFPIQRAIHLDTQGYSAMFQPECFSSRSQDLKEAYHDAGQFYWATPETWSKVNNLFEGMRPLLLPRWRVQDIDTEEDWQRAELLQQLLTEQGLINV
ncbi:pseudaminic acid cytidylyltransferase [Synechococcus sp. GEYO]|uniref:pseudaminic acid cytidylyltransferase n=1 Tax=Synechococcus sp. GEYO TaxID=2575511 RepID=UPI000E0F2819|nr:pseudaminic acid cytidylyltransferase [Synechococcus sp. GEYO]